MILTVYTKPNASQNTLVWIDEDTVKVSVTAVAENGKANEAVIALVAKELNVAKSCIEIIRGKTARIKQLKI